MDLLDQDKVNYTKKKNNRHFYAYESKSTMNHYNQNRSNRMNNEI